MGTKVCAQSPAVHPLHTYGCSNTTEGNIVKFWTKWLVSQISGESADTGEIHHQED